MGSDLRWWLVAAFAVILGVPAVAAALLGYWGLALAMVLFVGGFFAVVAWFAMRSD
jgi:hypothetical protein